MKPAIAPVQWQTALMPFFCPVEATINPACDEIEELCIAWIDAHHLYTDSSSRSRLIATKAAEIYSRALPAADRFAVADVAKWLYWGFATDDLLYDAGPVSVRAADFLKIAARYVRICEQPSVRFAESLPYEFALRDLAVAIRRRASPAMKLDWAHTARGWFFGMAWDVGNAERARPPSLNDYLMMRMHTGGLASWITTLNIANGTELSPEEASAPAVVAITECWQTFALLINDIQSYAKERRNQENSSNVITVIAHEQGCACEDALAEAYLLLDRMASLFLALKGQLWPTASDALKSHITGMEYSWRGIIEWGCRSARYVQPHPDGATTQELPGWRETPRDADLAPLPFPAIEWWWHELAII